MPKGPSIQPAEALRLLREGNQRFIVGQLTHASRLTPGLRTDLLKGQEPYASIITCADSRVSAEHIFDAALGEIFACENAGNIVDDITLGSVEYAAVHTGCPVLCVLGHTHCGAVNATIAVAKAPETYESPNIDAIIRRLLPAVLQTRVEGSSEDDWARRAERRHVQNSCAQITQRSALLAERIARGHFEIIGGLYDLATGEVEFLNL
jgi:carbonic anhydrase